MARARHVRSVPAQQGVAVQRVECERCGLSWNRPRRPGRVPRYCSDACKQAAWRDRVGPEEYNRRRRRAAAELARRRDLVWRYHAEFDAITAVSPLPASIPVWNPVPPAKLYKAAALKWHPDTREGDHKIFQLLQQAYRLAKLMA